MIQSACASARSIRTACSARSIRVERVDRIAHPQPEIGRHLIVARARRVQPAGRLADQRRQARLDVHVHVLEVAPQLQPAAVRLGEDGLQPGKDGVGVRLRYDAAGGQHPGMRLRGTDVLADQAVVEVDGGVDLLHNGGWTAIEATAPDRDWPTEGRKNAGHASRNTGNAGARRVAARRGDGPSARPHCRHLFRQRKRGARPAPAASRRRRSPGSTRRRSAGGPERGVHRRGGQASGLSPTIEARG